MKTPKRGKIRNWNNEILEPLEGFSICLRHFLIRLTSATRATCLPRLLLARDDILRQSYKHSHQAIPILEFK